MVLNIESFTKEWEESVYEKVDRDIFTWKNYESYNDLLNTRWINLLFQCWISRGWWAKNSWPLWADKSETINSKLKEYIQVVWHTKVYSIENYENIIYCDNLEYWDGTPLILDI